MTGGTAKIATQRVVSSLARWLASEPIRSASGNKSVEKQRLRGGWCGLWVVTSLPESSLRADRDFGAQSTLKRMGHRPSSAAPRCSPSSRKLLPAHGPCGSRLLHSTMVLWYVHVPCVPLLLGLQCGSCTKLPGASALLPCLCPACALLPAFFHRELCHR